MYKYSYALYTYTLPHTCLAIILRSWILIKVKQRYVGKFGESKEKEEWYDYNLEK